MKKYLIPILLLLWACNSTSNHNEVEETEVLTDEEKQQPDFDGIFEFRINKTTIKDLDTMKYKRKKIYSGYQDISNKFPEAKIIELANIKKTNIELEDVTLYFFRDTLISLSTNSNYVFLDVLKAKYPNYILDYSSAEFKWYNKNIEADLYKGRFEIKDKVKNDYLWKRLEEIENDSLRKQNKDL